MNYFTNASYGISHVFLMLFMYLFILHRYSHFVTALLCGISFLLLCVMDCFKLILFPKIGICYVIVTIMQIILTQSTAVLISRKRNVQVLFVGLSASSYVIAGSVSSVILQIWTHSDLWALAGGVSIHLAILLLLSLKIRGISLKFQEKKYMQGCWGLCLIPVFFYCSFSFIAFFPHTLYDNPDNIPGIIFFLITMFVSYIVVLRYLESESKKSAMHWKNMVLESYVKGLENQFYLVERAEKNLKILHHDVRHYSKMMDSLLEQKKYDEMRKVIGHVNDVAKENKVKRYCGNLVVNAILANMMDRASANGVNVRLDVAVSREIPVSDYEFTLVIANLLENALECVQEHEEESRWVEAKIHCRSDYLLLRTKNEYRGEIQLDSGTELPESRKKGNHGLGMQSALLFSEKIGGSIVCNTDGGIFEMMVFAKF